MTTLSSLITTTQMIIQDDSFSSSVITNYLNEGMKRIAGGIMIVYPDGTQAFSYPLPGLATSDTVDTSTTLAYISLPDDYGRDLFFAVSGNNGNRIAVLTSFGDMLARYPSMDDDSEVYVCAVRGSNLFYQGIPSTSDELTLHYYRKPTDMVLTTSEPDGLPDHLQSQILTNYAAWQIFDLIEDGMDGKKVNTSNAKSRFYEGMIELNAFCDNLNEAVEFGINDY